MTTTPRAEMQDIERMYDQAMASIADMTGPFAKPDLSDPWPATEEIDVAAIQPPPPPPPSRRPIPVPAPRRPWHDWFSVFTVRAAAAR